MGNSHLSPGIKFLLRCSSLLSVRLLAAFTAALGASWVLDASQSRVIPITAALLPLTFCVESFAIRLLQFREAAALGAIAVPTRRGKWPWGLDLLLQRLSSSQSRYPFDNFISLSPSNSKIYSLNLMGEYVVVTFDPNHVKMMLSTNFSAWEKGDEFRSQMGSVLGSGVFNSDGDMWKFHRSMTRPFFSRDRVSDFEIFTCHADEAIQRLQQLGHDGKPFDFQDLVSRFTLDSATEFLLGSCAHSLRTEAPPPFFRAFAQVQHRLARRARTTPLWPLVEIVGDKTSKNMKVIRDFIQPMIQEAQQRKLATEGEKTTPQTLLDDLIEHTSSSDMIVDEVVNILIAGRDTTASVLTFMTYCLALDPSILHRLRQEILNQVGEERNPNFDDIRQMKYLRAVINETLRLYPPVAGNVRSAIRSTTLQSSTAGGKPYYIPAGTKVAFPLWIINRHPDHWGPDAEIFDPDRFLDERANTYLVPNPSLFLPFSTGPRICLGQQFSYQEMSFFMIRLLQRYDHIELATDAQPPETLPPACWATGKGRRSIEKVRPKIDLTLFVMGGLWVRMRECAAKH